MGVLVGICYANTKKVTCILLLSREPMYTFWQTCIPEKRVARVLTCCSPSSFSIFWTPMAQLDAHTRQQK